MSQSTLRHPPALSAVQLSYSKVQASVSFLGIATVYVAVRKKECHATLLGCFVMLGTVSLYVVLSFTLPQSL